MLFKSIVSKQRTGLVILIGLTFLSLGLSVVFVLGQGGTGRVTPNANANRNPPTSKPRRSPSTTKPNERVYWSKIKLSTNPEDFRTYLKRWPKGQFAALARKRLSALETAAKQGAKTNSNSTPPVSQPVKPVPRPGSIVRNQLGMELVYIPPGSFMMGSMSGEADQMPVHEVILKEGFYIGRYEVTQGEWKLVVGNNPSKFKGDRLPVEQVSWRDAQSFIDKLNRRGDGFKYRLPTEAEWEYACRAGTMTDYAGNLDEMAWYSTNSEGKTRPVGGKRPNAWGLADMHGNVWEWCADYYHNTYNGAPTDGRAWITGGRMTYRVSRGGSWGSGPRFVRSAQRGKPASSRRYSDLGFRVVAVPQTE